MRGDGVNKIALSPPFQDVRLFSKSDSVVKANGV